MKRVLRSKSVASMGALLVAASVSLVAVPASAAPTFKCMGRKATIVGTPKADRLVGTKGNDVIVGRGGRDQIFGRGGNDFICAGGGSDVVVGGGGHDRIQGGKGHDDLLGGGGNDVMRGGPGSDVAIGGRGDDQIFLGGGWFQFADPGPGNDRVQGGPNPDLVTFHDAAAPVTVNLADGTATGQGTDVLVAIDGMMGSRFDDILIGDSGSNFIFGGPGNDRIESGGNLGDLEDPYGVIPEFRYDFLLGDGELGNHPPGDDTIIGGAGLNVVDYEEATEGVTVDLQAGTATGEGNDTLVDIQAAIGSRFADVLRGDGESNAFDGLAGNDVIDGRGGRDVLIAFDVMQLVVNLESGTATGQGTVFTETGPISSPVNFTLSDIEDVWGSFDDDDITGDGAANRLFGLEGDDHIKGLAGDDYLDGGDGPDTADGGAGDDDVCISFLVEAGCEHSTPQVTPRRGAPDAVFKGTGMVSPLRIPLQR